MIEQEKYTLNDGHLIPKIGLGTFQIRGYEGGGANFNGYTKRLSFT